MASPPLRAGTSSGYECQSVSCQTAGHLQTMRPSEHHQSYSEHREQNEHARCGPPSEELFEFRRSVGRSFLLSQDRMHSRRVGCTNFLISASGLNRRSIDQTNRVLNRFLRITVQVQGGRQIVDSEPRIVKKLVLVAALIQKSLLCVG